MITLRFLRALLLLALILGANAAAADLDRDGLDDAFEDALLLQFRPAFEISADECDQAPAELRPGSQQPEPIARNGSIYGQVFPAGPRIEIHYYHLWSRDCGRIAHPLDSEHVSVLLQLSATAWRAVYWFAAAHQGTVCDTSHGAAAAALDAEEHGPTVWISSGKHASFLSRQFCDRGCGSDRCGQVSLVPGKLINIGEPGALLNGALWAESDLWPLAAKMKTDFSDAALAQLDQSHGSGVIALNPPRRSMQAVISTAGVPVNALETSSRHTDSALSLANEKTGRALKRARRAVGRFLQLM